MSTVLALAKALKADVGKLAVNEERQTSKPRTRTRKEK
jgi:hypothetical protein